MSRFKPPLLDMTPAGEFRTPVRVSLSVQVMRVAMLIAVLSGLLVAGAIVLWIALWLIPVLLGAAFVAYALLRLQTWRHKRG